MYNEEYLGEDAYDVSDVSSEETTSSVNTEIKYQRKLIEYNKRNDPGYDKNFKKIDGENVKIETYSTPICCNAFIRHAIDGLRTNHRACSKYDDLYFIVADTTTNKGSRRLYFYSPQEFERTMCMTVPQVIKDEWNIKNIRANMLYNK
jgi:hypothetical protein